MLNLILISNGKVRTIESNNTLCTYSVIEVNSVSKKRRHVFEKCTNAVSSDADVVIFVGKDGVVSNIESNYNDDVYIVIYNDSEKYSELEPIKYAEFPKTQLNILDEYFDSITMANDILDVLCGVCDNEYHSMGCEDPTITKLLNIEKVFLNAMIGNTILKKEEQLELLDSVIECLVDLCSDSIDLIEKLYEDISNRDIE